jgi:diguanylate cyclase (GGDEF)-like protein/PAS domain S-box-containing protein
MKLESFVRIYQASQLIAVALIPSVAIWYLVTFSTDPPPLFEDHLFHEFAIAVATMIGGFVSYVSWRSYQASGEIFLRWLTVGFLAFTLIYAPHGLLTRTAHHNIWLFLLYGPVSRLAMVGCLVYGLSKYGKATENPEVVQQRGFWRIALLSCAVVVITVAALAFSPLASSPWVRIPLEIIAGVLCLAGVTMTVRRRIRSPLMIFYAVALLLFAQAAIAFILAKPWNHLWWLAHAIFAAGFAVIGWGVARALLTTRSFALAYSEEQLMRALEDEKARLSEMVGALQRSDAHLKSVFDASPDALLISDAHGRVVMANRQVTPLLGYTVDELIGQSIDDLVPDRLRATHLAQRAAYIGLPSTRPMGQGLEVKARRKDGSEFPVEVSLSQIAAGHSILVASAMRDVTARKEMEKELRNLAFIDAMTQLPNRRQFLDRLTHALRISKRHNTHGAVLFLDLNKFKQLNDTHGHEAGDRLLCEVARRLRQVTRDIDTVARLGGDEFVILLEGLDQDRPKATDHVNRVAEKIRQSLAVEYVIGDIRHHCSASIGIAIFIGDEVDPDQVIRNADTAMYEAKKMGRVQ